MVKMFIMKGLPGSGKSTVANEMLAKNGNTVRINKDLLRTMLHFDKFTGGNEGLTKDAARGLAKMFLSKGVNVIIDDTNLNPGTMQGWKDLARELMVTVDVIDLTTVPIEECVTRDLGREKRVGFPVIRNMALSSGIKVFEPDSVVICDIDGTISDASHRRHFVSGPTKDWKGFFSEMHKDPVRAGTYKALNAYLDQGKSIIFVSARPDNYRDVTMKWLFDNGLGFAYTLIMRKSNDTRPDTKVKFDILNTYFPDRSSIHTVIDDRPSVIRMWREQGLKVLDVGDGVEF